MDLNAASLATLNVAITTAFNTSLTGYNSFHQQLAMRVSSTGSGNTYPKLDDIPKMREWIGSRVVNRLDTNAFTLLNRKFENTLAVPVDAIEDDEYGIYGNIAASFGQTSAELPDDLLIEQIEKGFTTTHFDGQNFFDTDHPVDDENGTEVSVSNLIAGANAAWYIMDLSNPIKPFIFQDRTPGMITPKTNMSDDNVAYEDEFHWLAKRRCAVGFGAYQMAFASKAALTVANFETASAAMNSMIGPMGRKIRRGRLTLVVGTSNHAAAKKILKAEQLEGGGSNTNFDDMDLLHINTLS